MGEARFQVIEGDALERLREMEPESFQTCVTSPPYYGLRDYGNEDQIGLEAAPDEYVERLVAVFREVKRALADDGTLWLNLGDSYAGPSLPVPTGLKAKDLIGIPWMVAFALRADGWYVRDEIIWSKPAPMPTSAQDRTCRAHEVIYLLTRSSRYFYDQEAIAEPSVSDHDSGNGYARPEQLARGGRGQTAGWTRDENPTRIKRSVWTVGTANFPEAHFATFPPKLIEPCILAGSAEGDTVLDPFAGAGTTGLVALRHNRSFVGIELNPAYAQMARDRIYNDAPLLNVEAA